MITAIRKRYELIEQRADALAVNAMKSREPWTRAIPESVPDDRQMASVRVVATYRERWDISDPAPLGRRPDEFAHSTQRADHRRLTEMLRRLTVDSHSRIPSTVDPSTRRPDRTL
jgi:hypothetical protein